MPRGGVQKKITKTRAKQKIKTTTMIKATTRATADMGEIRGRIHRPAHRVKNLKAKSQVSE